MANKLRDLVAPGSLASVMSAHNPLSARLAELAGFDGVWASGFELSAAYGVPDASLLSFTQHLDMTRAMVERISAPVIADLDTGYGNAVNVMHVAGALVVGFAYAQLWLRLNAQGQRPVSPAGEMGPLPPSLLEWAGGVGSAPWQFAAALDMAMASFAERLTGKRADEGTGRTTRPSSNVAL